MTSFSLERFPRVFRKPDEHIATTLYRDVFAYRHPGRVVKVSDTKDKAKMIFSNLDSALSDIQARTASRRRIAEAFQERDIDPGIVPNVDSVIHQRAGGRGITYSEVQRWFEGSSTLGEIGWRFFKLPPPTLRNLREVFQLNRDLFSKEKVCLDITGSRGSNSCDILSRAVVNIFPLFNSQNILVEPAGTLRLIDIEDLAQTKAYYQQGLKAWIRCRVKDFGFMSSIAMLSGVLAIRSITEPSHSKLTSAVKDQR